MEETVETNLENTNVVEGVEVQTQTETTQIQQNSFDIKAILENEEFKKYMNSYADKRVSEAVKTNETKWKTKLEDEKKKLNMSTEELKKAQETEREQQLKELQEYKFKTEKMELFRENNFNMDLYDFIHGSNIDEIKDNTIKLNEVINNIVTKQVEEAIKAKFNSNVHIPQSSKTEVKTKLTDEQIMKMSQEELIKYLGQN